MKKAKYLVAAAGSGKTFAIGAVLRRLIDAGWHKKDTMSPWPIIYVTKSQVVTQTQRVLEQEFNIDTRNEVIVIGIDQLRARFGEMFVKETMKVVAGEEVYEFTWTPLINPKLIVWDEGHALKNHTSKQHKIALSFSKLPGVVQIFMSATPATRVSEFKCFVIGCGIKYNIPGLGEVTVNEKTWNDFARFIANGDQYEYNKTACDRLTDVMEPYIVRMKGIKPQFHSKNRTELIDFISKEGKEFYRSAEERFEKRKAKAEGRIAEGKGTKLEILVAILQYNIAAESNIDRIKIICDRMIEDVKNGYAPCCAMKFKISISKCLKYMFDKGVKRSEISVIWGGSKQQVSKKAATLKAINANDELQAALAAQGITAEGMGLDVDIQEEIKFDDSLNLSGNQSKEQRQKEIDNFQKGITKYCFFTMKSGGVGLSLHHSDAMIPQSLKNQALAYLNSVKDCEDLNYILSNIKNEPAKALKRWHHQGDRIPKEYHKSLTHLLKCRRKDSGYVVEEDIQHVPVRPRKLYSSPTYSAIDMVQVLGRLPRLTSLSDTEQVLLFFRGTIEEDVGFVCNTKLKCLSSVVRNHEDWQQIIAEGRAHIDRYKRDAKIQAENNADDPDTLIDDNDEGEDEE